MLTCLLRTRIAASAKAADDDLGLARDARGHGKPRQRVGVAGTSIVVMTERTPQPKAVVA